MQVIDRDSRTASELVSFHHRLPGDLLFVLISADIPHPPCKVPCSNPATEKNGLRRVGLGVLLGTEKRLDAKCPQEAGSSTEEPTSEEGAQTSWRRERDSNPRRAFDPYTLSRGAPSTTRPSLRLTQTLLFQIVAAVCAGRAGARAAMILKGGRQNKALARRSGAHAQTPRRMRAQRRGPRACYPPPAQNRAGRHRARPPVRRQLRRVRRP
jgi:hypothetical protein